MADIPAVNRVQTLNIELDGMSAYLKEVQSRVSQAAAEANQALKLDREQLERERRVFALEKAEMEEKIAIWNQRVTNANDVLRIDVGGSKFTTSKATLMAEKETYFHGLLSSSDKAADEDGEYFIDRNPRFFGIIVDYLRSVAAKVDFPEIKFTELSESERLQILSDAEFYQIESLKNRLKEARPDLRINLADIQRKEELEKERQSKDLYRAQMENAQAEADRLRKIIDSLPSRAQLSAADQRAAEMEQEMEESKKALAHSQEHSVPKSAHLAVVQELDRLRSHLSTNADDQNRTGDSIPEIQKNSTSPRGDRQRAAEIELLRLQLSQSLSQPHGPGRQDEVDRLRQTMADMVPKAQAEDAAAEVARLRSMMNSMVPRAEADSARMEAARLQLVVDTMVPRARVETLQAEVDRLQALNGGLVPKARAEAAEAEADRLRRQLDGMVARHRAEVAEAELERLRAQMDQMYPRARVEEAEEEAERLRMQLRGTVPRSELAAAQTEADGLRRSMQDMVPRSQLAAALSDAERLRRGAEDMMPRAEAEAARLADRLEVERLTRLADTQVGWAQMTQLREFAK
jgi:hypothetical protein